MSYRCGLGRFSASKPSLIFQKIGRFLKLWLLIWYPEIL